jgi:hypothetical protein
MDHVSERTGILRGMDELRAACTEVARRARFVQVETDAIPAYAAGLELAPGRW